MSIEVFEGNTQDPKTVAHQVKKLAERFGAKAVTFVGDRGMIKGPQMHTLQEAGHSYISAITKPQILSLLRQGVFQMELFDSELAEVVDHESGERYVLRRNPVRQSELSASHASKLASLMALLAKENQYLQEHAKAKAELALKRLEQKAKRLGLSAWVVVSLSERKLSLSQDEPAKAQCTQLDGCYVLKTNLTPEQASKEIIHERYKDLAQVEWAFRTAKTMLEMRPIYVRLASHTRAHALVVMLAYRLIQELASRWRSLDMTVPEGIALLNTLCVHDICMPGSDAVPCIPTPQAQVLELFELAKIRLPSTPTQDDPKVSTKKKLTSRRR